MSSIQIALIVLGCLLSGTICGMFLQTVRSFSGIIKASSAPLRYALSHLGQQRIKAKRLMEQRPAVFNT